MNTALQQQVADIVDACDKIAPPGPRVALAVESLDAFRDYCPDVHGAWSLNQFIGADTAGARRLCIASREGTSVLLFEMALPPDVSPWCGTTVAPVYAAAAWGATMLGLCVTGIGWGPSVAVGEIRPIRDHVNISGSSPLIGEEDALGPRFVDMQGVYKFAIHGKNETSPGFGGIHMYRGAGALALERSLIVDGLDEGTASCQGGAEALAAPRAALKIMGWVWVKARQKDARQACCLPWESFGISSPVSHGGWPLESLWSWQNEV